MKRTNETTLSELIRRGNDTADDARLADAARDLLEAAKASLALLTCAEMENVRIRGKAGDIKRLEKAIAKATN